MVQKCPNQWGGQETIPLGKTQRRTLGIILLHILEDIMNNRVEDFVRQVCTQLKTARIILSKMAATSLNDKSTIIPLHFSIISPF